MPATCGAGAPRTASRTQPRGGLQRRCGAAVEPRRDVLQLRVAAHEQELGAALLEQALVHARLVVEADRVGLRVQRFAGPLAHEDRVDAVVDRKSTRLNSSHVKSSYAVF